MEIARFDFIPDLTRLVLFNNALTSKRVAMAVSLAKRRCHQRQVYYKLSINRIFLLL